MNVVRIVTAEMKAALTIAQFYLVNIPLVDWKYLAGLGSADSVNKAAALRGQHGTGEQQITTGSALTAGASTNGKLVVDVFFLPMNQSQTPQFPAGVQHKTGILKHLDNLAEKTIQKSGQNNEPIDPTVHAMAKKLHFFSYW